METYKFYKPKKLPLIQAFQFTQEMHEKIKQAEKKPFWYMENEESVLAIPRGWSGFSDPLYLTYNDWLVIFFTGGIAVLTDKQFHDTYEEC